MNTSSMTDAGSPVPDVAADPVAPAMRFEWRGDWVLQLPRLPRMSGRLRAGLVLGLRRLPGTDLPERIAQRILEKLDGK